MSAILRIVLADSDPESMTLLKEMVESLRHQVVATAVTGRETIEHCQLCEPDLVITDATMPGMNGLEACQIIRGQIDVPVIVLEGDDWHAVHETGVPCCRRLAKPVDRRELEEAIEDVLDNSARASCAGDEDGNASHWFG